MSGKSECQGEIILDLFRKSPWDKFTQKQFTSEMLRKVSYPLFEIPSDFWYIFEKLRSLK